MADTLFSKKYTSGSGILELMDEMGKAIHSNPDMCMLGGGNPAMIPEVNAIWRKKMEGILKTPLLFEKTVTLYDGPQGKTGFLHSMADFLNREFNWNIGPENIAVTNGSQTGAFILFNLFGGPCEDGSFKKIMLPLSPEYIGYADQPHVDGMFTTQPAQIKDLGDGIFKYFIDFENLKVEENVSAIAVSRPTNPTGNVITDEEIHHLSRIAANNKVPLIIDNAYGAPFPGILFENITPAWDENTILTMSLSKLGLPSTRTGIIIARQDIIEKVSACNAIISLSNGTLGQVLIKPLLDSGEITDISRNLVKPFYESRSRFAQELFLSELPKEINFRIHKSEGALFHWFWFKNLSISSYELYNKLKEAGVLVVPGEPFFYGLDRDWIHSRQCIRINYAQDKSVMEKAVKIMGQVLKENLK